MPQPRIDRPALVVYAFSALGGSDAEAGWREVGELWRACRDLGEITAPLLGVDAPAHLPDTPPTGGGFRVVASARRATAGRVRSMFAFTEQDIAGVVAVLSADEDSARSWDELIGRWRATAPASTVSGRYQVLVGLAADDARVPEVATRLAAGDSIRYPADDGPPGVRLWQVESPDDAVFAVAGPVSAETAIDEWVWAVDGRQGLVPLTRYCLNLFRVEHQRRVHRALRPLADVIAESDAASTDLAAAFDSAGDAATPSAELIAADRRVRRSQIGSTGVLWRLTRVQDIAAGLRGTAANLARLGPGTAGGALARHTAELDRFTNQLDKEAAFLETLVRRADAVHAAAAAIIGAATQRRRDRITLVQTSFVGSLLMALAAIQSFQYTTPLHTSLKGPVIGALTAAAFGLPLLLTRWSGLVTRDDRHHGHDLVAAAAFGGALGWLVSCIAWVTTTGRPAPGAATAVAVGLGVVVLVAATWFRDGARAGRRRR
ncbi:CATRA conflict system CASPASE/TPR repeat-associated protein [Actinokineospora baliensis]|uniref:CATRA conflict system CASPASE/TPR repeat-associated protein n=1 Tax=Actinokineospora baliensis TaxID=547056 RepID=UPI001EF7A46F|nr:CATRA conflict system CASPASE/TPR repeat-associated protein [Actinokineospora baliensis]